MPSDPYSALGVTSSATDAELRHAYRELVKLHHPDHNGGSAERFEEVQEAYARVLQLRAGRSGTANVGATNAAPQPADASIDARIAAMEREIAERQRRAAAEQRQATAAAAHAAAGGRPRKPTREELGYVDTDDSFSAILDDAIDQIVGK